MKGKIFISYRRNDTRWVVSAIYQSLLKSFDPSQIFMDVDNIPVGADFVKAIETAVHKSDIFLAVIGKQWLMLDSKTSNRLIDNDGDYVRLEISTALKRKIPVIPILVDDMNMPIREDLPPDLKQLSRIQAIEINHLRFNTDIDRLIKVIKDCWEAANKEKEEQVRMQFTDKEDKIRISKENSITEKPLIKKELENSVKKPSNVLPSDTKLIQPPPGRANSIGFDILISFLITLLPMAIIGGIWGNMITETTFGFIWLIIFIIPFMYFVVKK